jgi:hypothetical protein
MSEAKEFVRKMNIVSTKDKEEKSDDANSEANNKVSLNRLKSCKSTITKV